MNDYVQKLEEIADKHVEPDASQVFDAKMQYYSDDLPAEYMANIALVIRPSPNFYTR